MATLEQRIAALEQQVNQGDYNYHVVICKGETVSPEEKAEAAKYARVIYVKFGKPKCLN